RAARHPRRSCRRAAGRVTSTGRRGLTCVSRMLGAMRATLVAAVLLRTLIPPAFAQTGWFDPALLERPDVKKALQSVDDRATALVDEMMHHLQNTGASRQET